MADSIVDDELFSRISSRAADYDRRNAFFAEDLEELREAGYLRLLVPRDLGGVGSTLEGAAREQMRLAKAAPATALAINMHLVWTSVATILRARGDDSLEWLSRDAAEGELFAFGLSEPGNDEVLFDSRTRAEPQPDGSYRFFGTKIFGSLSPAWTRLSVFGRNDSGSEPVLVHGFLRREDGGFHIVEDWDTVGMRATQSHTTVLEGARVPAERIARTLPVGPVPDPFIFGIFASFELLLAAVYAGIGERALEIAVESARTRTSLRTGGPLAHDPDVRAAIAEAGILQQGQYADVLTLARDVDAITDHGAAWFAQLVGVKVRVTRNARDVVDRAVGVVGGSAFRSESELARLARDVLAGQFHPSNDRSARRTVANHLLGPVPTGDTTERISS